MPERDRPLNVLLAQQPPRQQARADIVVRYSLRQALVEYDYLLEMVPQPVAGDSPPLAGLASAKSVPQAIEMSHTS